jgi:hypothetical protein
LAAEVKTFVLPFQVSRLTCAGWEQRAMEAWRREVRSLSLTPVECWVHEPVMHDAVMRFEVVGRVVANA